MNTIVTIFLLLMGLNISEYMCFFGKKVFSNKKKRKWIIIIIICLSLLDLWLVKPIVINLFVYLFIGAIIFYKHKSLTLTLFFTITMYVVIELTWVLTFDLYALITKTTYLQFSYHIIILLCILQIALYTTILIVIYSFDNKKNIFSATTFFSRKYSLFDILFFLFFMIVFFLRIRNMNLIHEQFWYSTALLFLLFLWLFSIVYVTTQVEQYKQKYIYFSKLNLQMKERWELSQEFRHDYKGILFTLTTYLEANDISGARKQLEEIKNYSKVILDDNSFFQLQNIHIPPILGILNMEFDQILQEKIKLNCQINKDIFYIPINLIDFARCLTILLDNAKEAAVQAKIPAIFIKFHSTKSSLDVTIKNSYVNNQKRSLKQMLEKNYTSKGNDHRGLGLHLLIKILNSYQNVRYSFDKDNYYFTVQISLQY